MEKGKGKSLQYVCNEFSLSKISKTPGSEGKPQPNAFSISKTSKAPAK